jgi:acyl-CoA thioesterase FadM
MEIKYLRPVPLGQPLTVTSAEQSVDGRRHVNMAEISNAKGEVLARSTGTFIAIDPEKMFAQHGVPAGISSAGGSKG